MSGISSFFGGMLNWLKRCENANGCFFLHRTALLPVLLSAVTSLFFTQEMELTLVGLQNAGKTTLVNVVAVSFACLGLFVHVLTEERLDVQHRLVASART